MSEPAKTDSTAERFTPDEVIGRQRNRQLMITSGIIIVLAIMVWVTRATRTTEAPLKEETLVGGTTEDPRFKKTDIALIQVWKGEGTKLELKRDGEEWRVPSRFDATADTEDVNDLITRIFDSSRMNRASTTTESQYVNYNLDLPSAVHLRLQDAKGAELLHVLVGRADGGSRDFVRLVGEGAPEGIFELTGMGGQFETLYGALKLSSDGTPQAKRWVSTKSFEPLPFDAVVQQLVIRDADGERTFTRKSASDPAADEWELTSPRKGDAEGTAVRTVIDALQNFQATDIAGRDTDAAKFGLVQPDQEVAITYTVGEKLTIARMSFGSKNDDNEVAVQLKTASKGTLIYYAGDYILSRIFRPTSEFMRKVRVNLTPDGVNLNSLKVQDGSSTLALARETVGAAATWKMTAPMEREADRFKVSNLLTSLSTLQGYPDASSFDRVALEIGPGYSNRIITAIYPVNTPEDSDGDDTPDTPDGETETTPDGEDATEDPPKTPEPPAPKVKTATLYFGKNQQGETPVLRVIEGVEQLFWIKSDAVGALFPSPADFVKLEDVTLLAASQKPALIRVANDGKILTLSYVPDAQGMSLWKLVEPWDETADQKSGDQLVQAMQNIRGAKLTEPLDKEKYKLGEGVSPRQIDLQVKDNEETKPVTLYTGERLYGMYTVLIKRADDTEEFWLVPRASLYELFVSPADFRVLPPFDHKVRHVLVTWKGAAEGLIPKDPERTEQQAWDLANDILKRAQGGEDFIELQKQYNEDSDATAVYDVNLGANLVKPFTRLSQELKVNEVGIVESAYGIHIIKRIE